MSETIHPRSRGPLIALVAVGAALFIVVVVVIVMTLGRGDDGTASPTPTGSPTSSSSPTPSAPATPTSTPFAAAPAFVMPECSAMRAGFITELIADGTMAESADDDPSTVAGRVPGPVAAATVDAAVQTRHCRWAIPNSDGIWEVSIAEIDDTEWDALVAALVAEGWTPTDVAGASGFTTRWEQSTINDEYTTWIYLRVRDAWIIAGPGIIDKNLHVLEAAVAGVRTVNP